MPTPRVVVVMLRQPGVHYAYQKGDLYCMMLSDRKTVYKFPLQHIFMITEISDGEEAHPNAV